MMNFSPAPSQNERAAYCGKTREKIISGFQSSAGASIAVEGLRIQNPGWALSPRLARAERVEVHLDLGALLERTWISKENVQFGERNTISRPRRRRSIGG